MLPNKPIKRIIYIQVIVIIAGVIAGFIHSTEAALSALLGGLAYLVPNLYFIQYMFVDSEMRNPQQELKAFYFAEIGKWLIAAIMFGCIFYFYKQVVPISLFSVYVATLLAPIFIRK
ncbi:MAG: ATP synthase subunit I [Pseudomonadota bacterium]